MQVNNQTKITNERKLTIACETTTKLPRTAPTLCSTGEVCWKY